MDIDFWSLLLTIPLRFLHGERRYSVTFIDARRTSRLTKACMGSYCLDELGQWSARACLPTAIGIENVAVPELTQIWDIKLNTQVALWPTHAAIRCGGV